MNPFYDRLKLEIRALGGMHNAHLHLDRAGTLDDRYIDPNEHRMLDNFSVSLHEKHRLIHAIHTGPAYEEADLRRRVHACLDEMTACDTRRADTLVDVCADVVGLSALETLRAIQSERGDIELRLASYSPLGFPQDSPERWELLERGAELSDFVAALPESDDVVDYPGHIGFEEHCRRMLHLAKQNDCMLHVHTDQRNDPGENGTERLLDAMEKYGGPAGAAGKPAVWAVHMISPSTYEEDRFERLVKRMLEHNLGLICCPSAALGMRQLRPRQTPTYNSIPRVLELLAAGVNVRLASDNIADICSPSTTPNLVDEVFVLSAALRYYHTGVLAKLACGVSLSEDDRELIAVHLSEDAVEVNKALGNHA
ncbi:MAG: hypothetical protein AAGA91_13785 [Pseudomonadota bacterium]